WSATVEQVARTFGEAWPEALDVATQLVDACRTEARGKADGTFLQTLDLFLQAALTNGQVFAFEDALSVLRRGMLPLLSAEERQRAEDLWHQARVRIAEAEQQFQGRRRLQAEQRTRLLREVSQQLGTTFHLRDLMDILARELPRLGVRRGYVALYEDPQRPAEWARLFMAFGPEGQMQLEAEGRRFPSREIVPPDLMPDGGGLGFVVEPLYFREQQLGFAVLEAHAQDGTTADALRVQISSSLQGARLVQQVERRALLLQAAAEVSRLATSTLDPERLIRQVVDLVRERFDLYYVGLFLLDRKGEWTGEPQKWLVLRAGTGEAGRQMVAQGHRLEIGGTSMVGWCALNRRPRVAHEVEKDPVHRPHPLLPETRSEVAVPLRVGESVIGVLDAQSKLPGTFDEDLVTVFQTMADQVAVAIENAFTVSQMQLVNEDLQQTLATQEQLLETIRQLSTPVVPLLEGVILLPLVGHIDSRRAAQVMEELLMGVQRHRARVAIVDITGVPVVDTAVANSLLRAAQATYLLGAEVILVGIRPEVAQTIVGLGVELRGLVTMSDLQSGIEYALQRMGNKGAA
ncbi:MAG: GAF domain-containing protein, partial [Chloroflexia bacterium]